MYDYAIIFENDTSPLAAELSEKLKALGLVHSVSDTLDGELLGALNAYRSANYMSELNFCDPSVLRLLGIDAGGDEIITLAKAAEILADTELEYFDICSEIVHESRKYGITVTEACTRRDAVGKLPQAVSEEAMRAAALAFINE